jgi:hypothetical protein
MILMTYILDLIVSSLYIYMCVCVCVCVCVLDSKNKNYKNDFLQIV